MANYQQQNVNVFNAALEKYAQRIEDRIAYVLGQVAQETVIFIEGGYAVPVYTSNLRDSTGVGVYKSGKLFKYVPVKQATEPRNIEGVNLGKIFAPSVSDTREYWGFQELDNALQMAVTQFSKGIWIVVFSTMPYAYTIDEKYNFFNDGVVDDLVKTLQRNLQQIKRVG